MKKLLLVIVLYPVFVHAQNTFPATGNVGIGTTSPQYTLEVNGLIKVGNIAIAPAGSNGLLYYNSTSQTFQVCQSGT